MTPDLPANHIANLSRRVNRARRYPANTCPASRHVHLMAEGLASAHGYPMLHSEPRHCAESLLAVLESLWRLRSRDQALTEALRQLLDVCQRMDAEHDAQRPTEREYQRAIRAARKATR